MEADDIIHELTKLVDISRNKGLQKKLLHFADASIQMINQEKNTADSIPEQSETSEKGRH